MYTLKDFLSVRSATEPSFSPDGKHIAYLSNISGTFQIYLVPREGGEAKQLTSYPDPIDGFSFSPTNNQLIFSKANGGDEKFQIFLLNVETLEVQKLTDNPDVRYDWGNWSADGKCINYCSTERNGTDSDVYVMDVSMRKTECIYQGGGRGTPTAFSPQGTYTCIKRPYSNVETDLYLYNFKTKETTLLTTRDPEDVAEYSAIRWLPDESGFFLMTSCGRDFVGVSFYDIQLKTFKSLLTPQWDVEGIRLSHDATTMTVKINEEGYHVLKVYNVKTWIEMSHIKFPKGILHSSVFSKDDAFIAYAYGDAQHANNIWVYSFKDNTHTKLTHSPQNVPSDVLVQPQLIHFSSFDGLQIPAFMYTPKDLPVDKKLPVIIQVHGGPESQWRPGLTLVTQFFVHHGYTVVAPNVRGSTGYGKQYCSLDDIEKRLDSVKDLVALHAHLSALPSVDANKIALMGGSYGGYMTMAGLAFYPELWAAGVNIVGIVNFITFLENTASYRRALREVEYGYLDKHRDLLKAISPIHAIDKIRAPLILIHGANDPRVPLSEAEQVVSKMKELGREVKLLVYPDEGHGLHKLKNILDAYPQIVEFLDKALK
jgi:dipeptidyl aminopeptidase/acylaminoacyl peptidase